MLLAYHLQRTAQAADRRNLGLFDARFHSIASGATPRDFRVLPKYIILVRHGKLSCVGLSPRQKLMRLGGVARLSLLYARSSCIRHCLTAAVAVLRHLRLFAMPSAACLYTAACGSRWHWLTVGRNQYLQTASSLRVLLVLVAGLYSSVCLTKGSWS